MIGDIGIGVAKTGLAMTGDKQGFRGLIRLDNRVEVPGLLPAFDRARRGQQGFEDFEPFDTCPLKRGLGAVGEIGVEIIPGGVLGQAQPGRHFRIVSKFIRGNRGHQIINLARNPAGCARIVHSRRTGSRQRQDSQSAESALENRSH